MDSWKKLMLCVDDRLCGGILHVVDEEDEELWNDLTFHEPPLPPPIPRVVRLTPQDDDDSLLGLEYMQESTEGEGQESTTSEFHSEAEEESFTIHSELYQEQEDTTVLAEACCHDDDDIRFLIWSNSSWSRSIYSREEDEEDGSSYSSYGFNRGSLLDRPTKSTPTKEKSQRTLNTASTSTSTLEKEHA